MHLKIECLGYHPWPYCHKYWITVGGVFFVCGVQKPKIKPRLYTQPTGLKPKLVTVISKLKGLWGVGGW